MHNPLTLESNDPAQSTPPAAGSTVLLEVFVVGVGGGLLLTNSVSLEMAFLRIFRLSPANVMSTLPFWISICCVWRTHIECESEEKDVCYGGA